ncbi:MAG: hypothetical protein IKJ65_06565 [Clostridia bacterium]|nr:hypothetical protein [Clostridia bacterium]
MNRCKSFTYRINFEKENIEISNAFATAAKTPKTPAHIQLMELRDAYPGFGIVIYKTQITQNKQKYKGLNFAEMRRCIIKWDGECSPNLAAFDKATADKVPYPVVKQWYLGIYGEHYKRAADVTMPVMEDTAAVGNTDTAAGNC